MGCAPALTMRIQAPGVRSAVLPTRWNPSSREGLKVPCCMWPAVSKNRERCDSLADMPLALCLVAFRYPLR
jgi:hypothetical protein